MMRLEPRLSARRLQVDCEHGSVCAIVKASRELADVSATVTNLVDTRSVS